MSNCTLTGQLSSIVPTDAAATTKIDGVPQTVVQALPVTLGFLLWISLEFARRKRAVSDNVRRIVRIVTLVCTAAVSLVAWRFATVLTCETDQTSIVWNVIACASLAAASYFVLFALALRRPRLAILASLLVAGGLVVVDVGLRGWWRGVDAILAAQHLMPLQHLWVLHAITVLLHLERSATLVGKTSSSSTVSSSASVVEVVDSLARRDDLRTASRGGACSERGRERSNARV